MRHQRPRLPFLVSDEILIADIVDDAGQHLVPMRHDVGVEVMEIGELADFHNLYADIMAHWHKVLPGVVHDVRYEDFVADQEGQTRALMAHLGLPWDDKVLSFHETDRPVRTASAAQVRQPMYQGSVDLWKQYGDRLKPLLDMIWR